ncbi:type I-E CRISPR-associated protein Cse1/CasA [Streptomyces sp. NPDC006733]|uniref:type I-E CRISPR-associated protein Cse1/CasA n=1 Tax=Streptomyces sp. NPDC006733 TaxID=3155460 RepID=UPI0033D68D5A
MTSSAPSPARAGFSAADDGWIDVRSGTAYCQVGLREMFLTAHTLDDLAIPTAPAASALLRICAAITARITALDDPELTAEQWVTARAALFALGRFNQDAVNAYFDDPAHCFEVFDPNRPFLQDPMLASQCPAPSGINRLVFGRPSGNNLAWLSPHHDLEPLPVPTPVALQHLLIHHYYGASGATTPRTVGSRKPDSNGGRAGPLRSTVSFHPLGRTLHETLLAQVPHLTGEPWDAPDTCPWEGNAPPAPDAPLAPVTWPGRLLTGRSRHALLLVPSTDGTYVSDVYLTWSTKQPALSATDPYLVMRTATKKKTALPPFPRRADADRAWWRELDALLLAPDEHRAFRRPQIFDTLNDLPPDVRANMRVRVHGFDQDGKVNNRHWYTAITPPILTWAQEHDPQRAERIAQCVAAAEDCATRLSFLTGQAWKDTIDGPGTGGTAPARDPGKKTKNPWATPALAAYWPLAEQTFWRLLHDLDTPARAAFVTAAENALRTVTRSDRIRYRHAARAVAAAVAQLRRPPRARTEGTDR